MSRVSPTLNCSENEIQALQSLTENGESPQVKLRAQSILLLNEGKRVKEVAQTLSVRKNTVIEWRRRYQADGIAGLQDRKPVRKQNTNRDTPKQKDNENLPQKEAVQVETLTISGLEQGINESENSDGSVLKEAEIQPSKVLISQQERGSETPSSSLSMAGLYLSDSISVAVFRREESVKDDDSSQRISEDCEHIVNEIKKMSNEDKNSSLLNPSDIQQSNCGKKDDIESFFTKTILLYSLSPVTTFLIYIFAPNGQLNFSHDLSEKRKQFYFSLSFDLWINKIMQDISDLTNGKCIISSNFKETIKFFLDLSDKIDNPFIWITSQNTINNKMSMTIKYVDSNGHVIISEAGKNNVINLCEEMENITSLQEGLNKIGECEQDIIDIDGEAKKQFLENYVNEKSKKKLKAR